MNLKSNPRILTIDDDRVIRESIRAYLEDYDYTILEADSGRIGLDILEEQEVDLVIADLRMPELDGLAVLSAIKQNRPELPVIVISGTGEISDVVEALRLGAWDYLLKPVSDMSMLLHAIEKCLERAYLLQENREYQLNLETLVTDKTQELSTVNTRLKRVVESTRKLLGCGRLAESATLLLREFGQHMEATGGSIYEVRSDSLRRLASLDGGHAAESIPFPLEPGSVFHRVMEQKDPLFLHDIDQDDSIISSGWDKYIDNSLLVFPIPTAEGEILAILSLHSKKKPPFNIEDRDIGSLLASYAGEALQVANVSSALKESEERLRQAHKLEAIGTLAGGIAHDFNNILGAIIGYTDLSLISESCDESIRRNLEQVKKASDRAKDLVAQILAFSRTDNFKENIIDIAPIVKEALKLLRATIPSSIIIEADIPENLGKVATEPTKIYQVIMNLCTNAAHAMDSREGHLSVEFAAVEKSRLPLEAQKHRSKRWLRLSVADNGEGIRKENLERIFDPYFTTKEKGEGTGLGLAMVHAIVRASGGVVKVESELGIGSVFHLFFPAFEGDKVMTEDVPLTAMKRGDESILFVDDEQVLGSMAGEMLEKLGYQVEVLDSSTEALRILTQDPYRFDLLITDQTMSRLSGMDLARGILQIRADFPVILSSGYSSAIDSEELKKIGIRDFLMKPLSMNTLAEAVRKALES